MPVLSMFFGIIVRMYRENGGRHNMPHIHAEYAGEEVVVTLDGEVIEGKIPKNKMKLLEAWIEIHREDLEANWKLLSNGEQFFREIGTFQLHTSKVSSVVDELVGKLAKIAQIDLENGVRKFLCHFHQVD